MTKLATSTGALVERIAPCFKNAVRDLLEEGRWCKRGGIDTRLNLTVNVRNRRWASGQSHDLVVARAPPGTARLTRLYGLANEIQDQCIRKLTFYHCCVDAITAVVV
jgi:hypothetical protein